MTKRTGNRIERSLQGFILSVLMPGASKTLTFGLTEVTPARRQSRGMALEVLGGKKAMSRTARKLGNRPKDSEISLKSLTILD
jgi:hypothetical protein